MSEPVNESSQPEEQTEPQDELDVTDAALEDVIDEAEAAKPETRDEEMQRLRHEVAEAEKRVLMAQADAENFRKRTRRDFEEQKKYAAQDLVAGILEVRDNLIRAIEASENATDSSGLHEGVTMVAKQLDDTLAKFSVREIPAEGELFDPNFHEAISQVPSDTHPSGTIAHVAQTGFQMHDRVVRPSHVVVSTGPAGGDAS